MMDYFDQLNPRQIWNIRQNRPTLVAHDLQHYGVPTSVSYSILLGRGVFKWLSVRRDLIKIKDIWKKRVTASIEGIREAKRDRDYERLVFLRGYLKAYEEARAEVRALCHSSRFRAPDFDREAQKFLFSLCQSENEGE